MKKDKTIRISQCMIVKNEEKNIKRALFWGKEVMWEQVVVDTGSTDRTVELACEMGAKVYHYLWTDDFSAAKNYAIEKCSGDWIALLDADEYMVLSDVQKLPNIIEELERRNMDGLSTGWQQIDDKGQIFSSGTQVRFFRNDPDIRYRRRIHEQLESVSGRELRLGDVVNELSIFHTGYQAENQAGKKRSGRNRRLIQEELKENPKDYEMMGYMGDECLTDGNNEEAKQWYFRSIEHMPSQLSYYDQRSAVTFTRLLMLLGEKEDVSWNEVEKIYQKAVNLFPQEADLDYEVGKFFAIRGQAEKAAFYLESGIKKLDIYGCSNKALVLSANLLAAYDLLVKCCYESGQIEKCLTYGVIYLKYDKYGMAVLSKVLKVLTLNQKETSEEINIAVIEILSKMYDFSQLKDKLFLVKTARLAEVGKFADFAIQYLFDDNEKVRLKL
ncbi:MAG: glycosyltransferase family 2 protein [Hungatella sp.]|nr:glycosyltransferase family 2 protein [Hungatella sp.]